MENSSEGRSGYLLVMSLGAIGVVFGDIGTSPLYALREAFVAADGLTVSRESVFGILSLILWALILVVTVKYLVVVLRADNHGEGGILALTALVAPARRVVGRNARWGLLLLGLFGAALLYGDGAITPAISVLSAVEGLEVATPGLADLVVPVSVAILILLFAVQRTGTGRIGAVFGPIMVVWFTVLAALGVGQVAGDPSVLQAANPVYAARFVLAEPNLAFLALGAIFLVVTGSEALYADMGHFGKRPIRLAWLVLVFPALLIHYFGQGALLLAEPTTVDNPFYRMPPEWAVLPLVVLATMATVIASQALISGAYSLTMQAVQLGYLPRVRIDHTSPREIGQVYVRSANYALMVAAVGLVLAFRSSTNLAAAYGVAVTSTMLITTLLLYVVMRERWGWKRGPAIVVTMVFLLVDTAFLAANLVKIPDGGWVPLVGGLLVFVVMTTWSRGRSLLNARQRRGDLPIERFVGSIVDHPQRRVPGTAIYLFPDPGATPPALLTNLRHNEILHETVVTVAVKTASVAHVPPARRAALHTHGDGFHQVTLRFGFMDTPDVPVALGTIVSSDWGFDPTDTTFVLGRETVVPSKRRGMALWRERLFAVMHRNASGAAEHFRLPADDVIEIGSRIEI